MNNNLDALRNLYVALGGEASAVENLVTNPDLINAIAEAVGGVIRIATVPFTVTVTLDEETYKADTDYKEIENAYYDGNRIVLNMEIGGVAGYAEFQGKMGDSLVFAADDFANNLHYVVAVNEDESVVVKAYTLTPAT